MTKNNYRLNDIARRIDRDKTTIIRWEKQGLIPKAHRDSRGWRYYTHEDVERIVQIVEKTHYFQDLSDVKLPKGNRSAATYMSVMVGVAFMMFNLFNLGTSGVNAFSNQTTTLYTTISAGILDIVDASSSVSFVGVSVEFTSQTSTSQAEDGKNDMGAFNISDKRGSQAGWTVNLAGSDWRGNNGTGEITMQLDHDATGSDGNLGKMCYIPGSGAVRSESGQDETNVSLGSIDCFSGAVSQIDLVTASAGFGAGDYWITDVYLEQFIPSNPTAQSLTTTIVITVS